MHKNSWLLASLLLVVPALDATAQGVRGFGAPSGKLPLRGFGVLKVPRPGFFSLAIMLDRTVVVNASGLRSSDPESGCGDLARRP